MKIEWTWKTSLPGHWEGETPGAFFLIYRDEVPGYPETEGRWMLYGCRRNSRGAPDGGTVDIFSGALEECQIFAAEAHPPLFREYQQQRRERWPV